MVRRWPTLTIEPAPRMAGLSGPMAGVEVMVGMMTGALKSGAPVDQAVTALRGYHQSLGQELPEWCTAELVDRVRERMRQVLGHWKAVPYRETMEIEWRSHGR